MPKMSLYILGNIAEHQRVTATACIPPNRAGEIPLCNQQFVTEDEKEMKSRIFLWNAWHLVRKLIWISAAKIQQISTEDIYQKTTSAK